MSLLKSIKDNQLQARKNKKKELSTSLTTLLGEAAMVGKNNGDRESTDEEVIIVIKKFIKNNEEVIKFADIESKVYINALEENVCLTRYLPDQLTESEISNIVLQYIEGLDETPSNMGEIMRFLKENYAGKYNGKDASNIVKELLNG